MSLPTLGAVLAGGRSRRMGQDKALLRFEGRPLVEAAARVLAGAVEEVVVITRPGTDYDFLEIPVLEDRIPGCGPLGGIHTALLRGAGRPAFILACDLPFVGSEAIRFLLRRFADERPAALIPALGGRPQPLCGVYAPACLERLETELAARRLRVLDFVERIEARVVEIAPELPFYRPDLLENVNRPEESLRAGLEEGER